MSTFIDFETYSELDIKKVGAYKYAKHPSTKILMMSYKVNNDSTEVWEPGDPVPYLDTPIYAHNAVFEYIIWSNCGEAAGLPRCPLLSQFIDVMHMCGKFAYPLGLGKAAAALGTETPKDKEGNRLIKKFCGPTGHDKHTAPDDWERFRWYCRDDTEVAYQIVRALPEQELSLRERWLWHITQSINLRGVPIDTEGAAAVYRYTEAYKEAHQERMPELTGGVVTKPTQVKRIKDWCEAEGYPMVDGLGAQLIEDALTGPNPPPPHVAEVLEMRKEFGSSSTAKFKLAVDLAYKDRIHGCLIKNGATTGRYASWTFQLHNLAKLKPIKEPNELFQDFKDIKEIDRPLNAAKSLVRAIIKAPHGKELTVADWSGIETCLLFWFVQDIPTLKILHARGDLYKEMAGAVYGIRPDEVDRDTQRPLGKALILGAGYGMGYKRFQQAAKTFGVEVNLPEANRAIRAYRAKYPLVQRMWYRLTNAAKLAVLNPGQNCECGAVSFQYTKGSLWTTLPSGRKLHYPEACIKEGDVQYKGVRNNQWTTMRLTPSQNIENIIQAMAVDILEDALVRLNDHFRIIFHVHDEIVTETDKGANRLDELVEIMCTLPDWATGLPLFAEGYIAERFKK